MADLNQLRTKLQLYRRECAMIPAEDVTEQERRSYREKIILVQIEAEQYRQSIRTSFHMSHTRYKTRIVNDLEITTLETVFKWESMRDAVLAACMEKETKVIQYYTEQLNKIPV